MKNRTQIIKEHILSILFEWMDPIDSTETRGRPRYGFKKPKESAILSQIVAMYTGQGKSAKEIADELNRTGVEPQSGSKWYDGVIKRMAEPISSPLRFLKTPQGLKTTGSLGINPDTARTMPFMNSDSNRPTTRELIGQQTNKMTIGLPSKAHRADVEELRTMSGKGEELSRNDPLLNRFTTDPFRLNMAIQSRINKTR